MVVESSGTQTATLTTEHSLATPSTAKTRALLVDAKNLAIGETLTLRIKAKVLTGGTEEEVYYATYVGPPTSKHTQSPPVIMPFGGTFTLTQTGGTGRAYDWSVVTLD